MKGRRRKQTRPPGAINPRSEWRTRQLKVLILNRDGPTCWLCHGPIPMQRQHPHPLSFSVDHVIALADGGDPFDPANARPSHLTCNTSRGAREGNRKRARRNRERTELTW